MAGSNPHVKEAIQAAFKKYGEYTETLSGIGGLTRSGRRGWVIKAEDAHELQEKLSLGGSAREFGKSLSSLMYNDRVVVRLHIDGARHFKLLDR